MCMVGGAGAAHDGIVPGSAGGASQSLVEGSATMERPEYPYTPANRLDVQRHRLEEQRAGYAHMNARIRVERDSRFRAALRMVRGFVAGLPSGHRRDRVADVAIERAPDAGALRHP
jgi:hypothetical protein